VEATCQLFAGKPPRAPEQSATFAYPLTQRESGFGVEAQRAAIEHTAARLNLTLAAIYTDSGLSGSLSIEDRPS
jgi:hypothetical protein